MPIAPGQVYTKPIDGWKSVYDDSKNRVWQVHDNLVTPKVLITLYGKGSYKAYSTFFWKNRIHTLSDSEINKMGPVMDNTGRWFNQFSELWDRGTPEW